MSFTVIDAEQQPAKRFRELFVIKPDGSLLWVNPPKNHPDLRGRDAGSPVPNQSDNVYWCVQVDGKRKLSVPIKMRACSTSESGHELHGY